MSAPESKELIYYYDKKCKKPFPFIEGTYRQYIISSKIVRQGKSASQVIYLKNHSQHEYQMIQIIVNNPTLDVKVRNGIIKSGGVSTFKLIWQIPNELTVPYTADFVVEGNFIIE